MKERVKKLKKNEDSPWGIFFRGCASRLRRPAASPCNRWNKEIIILLAILALAVFLRFWQLGKVPASPDWDEAALGYNAYSLLKTGRDEYGARWPLILRSFDDYKPALYAYLAILPIKFFGLNLWSVRLPAAVVGSLAVFLVYFLVKELFVNSKLALIASFLLAISPWHLQFSRAAFESGVGMFFNVLIALLFLEGLKRPKALIFSAFFAGLNLYAYQAEKIFTPLLALVLVVVWRKQVWRISKKYLVAAFLVGLLTAWPFIRLTLTTPDIFLRAKGTSFASDQTVFLSRTVQKLMRDYESQDTLGLILDNRRVTYLLSFISGYLSHFNFNWLFISGDDTRHHAPGMGLIYLVELPFLLYGVYQLIFDKGKSQVKWLVFSWVLLAPLPAAFTSGVPHAVRALRFLPIIQILVAFGILQAWQSIRKRSRRVKLVITSLVLVFFLFNFSYFINQYFVQLNYFTSQTWQYGYQQAVEEIKKIEGKYDKIIVSSEPHLDQSYMFFLYFLQYDPAAYLAKGGTISGGFAEDRNAFGKYVFRPIDWSNEEKSEKILYIGRPDDFAVGASVHKTVNFIDGLPAIAIVKGK